MKPHFGGSDVHEPPICAQRAAARLNEKLQKYKNTHEYWKHAIPGIVIYQNHYFIIALI